MSEHSISDLVIRETYDVTANNIQELSSEFLRATREKREEVLHAVVHGIIRRGTAADLTPGAADDESLRTLGGSFEHVVLSGTSPRQFVSKIATRLALTNGGMLPKSVLQSVVEPMIKALYTIVVVGSPATRDAAVEGLGGLLKLSPGSMHLISPSERPKVAPFDGEDPTDTASRQMACTEYFARLDRRRLLVLTIAGEAAATTEFWATLRPRLATQLDELLRADPIAWDRVEDLLYSYPDLLRILPAVARQTTLPPDHWLDLLCDTIQLPPLDARHDRPVPEAVTQAFARLQENVFRTLDTVIRRFAVNWRAIDVAIGNAVRAIPRALEGSPSACNQTVRSTVALLRTASRLLTSATDSTQTKEALLDLFGSFEDTPWFNLGVIEGALRILSDLLPLGRHDDLSEPLVRWLAARLAQPPGIGDLPGAHCYLVANSCLRRIATAALDRAAASGTVAAMQRAVAALLCEPIESKFYALRYPGAAPIEVNFSTSVAPALVASVVFEAELLRRTGALLGNWPAATSHERVLLTRILALQLHSLARDERELERYPLLQQFWHHSIVARNERSQADSVVMRLLQDLPPDAADTADTEIQRFVEFRGYPDDKPGGLLPGYVVALVSTCVTDRIASAVAREISLHMERQSLAGSADLTRLLYQVLLRDPHPSIFDHLWPRVRDQRGRAIVLLFRRHVVGLGLARRDAANGLSENHSGIRRHVIKMLQHPTLDLAVGEHGALEGFRDVLSAFEDLTSDGESVWDALAGERAIDFIGHLDSLAEITKPGADPSDPAIQLDEHRAKLAPLKKGLADLQDDVAHYQALPVGQFSERQSVLSRMLDHVIQLRAAFSSHRGVQEPERILLTAFADHAFTLFDDTRRWFCDEARKLKERNERERFWLYFCAEANDVGDDEGVEGRLTALGKLERQPWNIFTHDAHEYEYHARIRHQLEKEPQRFRDQRRRFAKFFVEWMESDLDVATLKRTLRTRWPFYFRALYAVTTSFPWLLVIMLLPFVLAGWFESQKRPEWAGVGFFSLASGLLISSVLVFTQILSRLKRKKLGDTDDKTARRPGFWFRCLLPRLARLTAVPMALIVEFEHNYEYPLHASTLSILSLTLLSFVTTRFFVVRELTGPEDGPDEATAKAQGRRAWQVVAVTLAHSFSIAVVLSAIFASSYDRLRPEAEPETVVETIEGKPSAFWTVVEAAFEKVDNPKPGERYPRFLGVIPRVAKVDVGAIASGMGFPLPVKVAEAVVFRFYPTIVLVWTALGLFFGVFLEGFMKGERLRGTPFRTDGSSTL